ncbi:MAG: hypothetical protein R3A48_05480 [Polyangiales bacterium]
MAAGGCGAVAIVAPQADGGAVDVVRVDVPAPQDLPTTRTCVRQSDCPAGSECVGPEGCGVPWTCVAGLGRPCTDDLAPFCGCDGQTIFGSSSCPPGPYRARGPCETPVSCLLPNGGRCAAGQTCALDRCTSCLCATNGELRCESACPPDGGAPRPCRSNTDCARGEQCQGPEGCGVTWTCSSGPVGCTADIANFCGCDGRTFQGSSSCPGRNYEHRGPCESVDAGAPVCVIRGVACPVNATCDIDRCVRCRCAADLTVSCEVTPGCSVTPDAGAPCAPVQAMGEGGCERFLGYAWNGTDCVGLSGCRCVGPGCDQLAPDREACLFAHLLCPR